VDITRFGRFAVGSIASFCSTTAVAVQVEFGSGTGEAKPESSTANAGCIQAEVE
jgi:hypothetical protein